MPEEFAFAVKAPREITHRLRLIDAEIALDAFLAEVNGLGRKLGPLLFQLPPKLGFDTVTSRAFFAALRARFAGDVTWEPRHPDWFTAPVDDLLQEFRIGRVAADPPVVGAAAVPGGWDGFAYFRLHGSPRVYYSEYGGEQIEQFAERLTRAAAGGRHAWCIFDNTAAGAGTSNALALQELVGGHD